MRNQHQRTLISTQPALQPDHGIEIEVVAGLVQQQEVRPAHQRARQAQSHAPATRKLVDRTMFVTRHESKTMHETPGTAARRVAVYAVEPIMQAGQYITLVVRFRNRDFAFKFTQFHITVEHILDRGASSSGRLLGNVGNDPVRGHVNSPESVDNSPRISANRLDLPQPLAPEMPHFLAVMTCRVVSSSNSRVPRRRAS